MVSDEEAISEGGIVVPVVVGTSSKIVEEEVDVVNEDDVVVWMASSFDEVVWISPDDTAEITSVVEEVTSECVLVSVKIELEVVVCCSTLVSVLD